jgi:hypothetical protein
MSGTQDELKRAYNFIKHDQTDEAQAILRPILAQEPENVHAWWLLAHALTDPGEIRDALTNVITLDPNYSNAGKARELLAQLDEHYPKEVEFPGFEEAIADEGVFATGLVEEEEASSFWEEPLDSAFQAPEETPFLTGEQFPELGEDFFAAEEESEAGTVFAATPPPGAPSESDLRSLFEFHAEAGTVDEGAEAAREEKAARRRGRGGRLLRLTAGALFIVAVVVILVAVVTLGGSKAKADPGPLKVLTAESENVQNALSGAKGELMAANLGSEEQVIVAESALGQTLFVEFCAQPTPDLPQLVAQGMDIAARQARSITDTLPAVGVSVDLCKGETRDNLYRAFVSTAEAIRYMDGDLGQGEVGAASFQALWKTS